MFILSSTSSGIEFWSVNHISIQENSELNIFKNLEYLHEISNNSPNDFFGKNVYNTFESRWQLLWQYCNKLILL